ncbi:hypothetical protein LEP1GSC074_2891 [Leptospira noguchii str. Hook]|nr:hypothetical protein LEP1GSC074_2891 [Leptospira noguchii str. Hook]TQE83468.1 hypothetical protein FF021_00900 [Leptospira noguchii]
MIFIFYNISQTEILCKSLTGPFQSYLKNDLKHFRKIPCRRNGKFWKPFLTFLNSDLMIRIVKKLILHQFLFYRNGRLKQFC